MLFNVIGYSNQIIGQVEASDVVEAWSEAGKKYENILDVRVTESSDYSSKKEPWQMTLEEYAYEEARKYEYGKPRMDWIRAGYGETYRSHKIAVERAIKEGKQIPSEVLRDYPTLTIVSKGEPPYGEKLREWVSLYGGYIEYHPEIEGYKIKKSPEAKSYVFANSQTTKRIVQAYLAGV